ncbi:MAG: ATP-binding protein, partial [Candidatus Methanomethylophilaceae archaeon]
MENNTKVSVAPLDEWIEQQTFSSTEEIAVPEKMADQVIGQDKAVEVIKKAASQKRHVMLIGEPGTGKSMLANSMVEYLPQGELQDVIAYHNPEDFNEPRIRVLPAGKGKPIVTEQKLQAAARKSQKNNMILYLMFGIIALGIFYFIYTGEATLL